MKIIKLLLFLFVGQFSFSQTENYEKGMIIDSILVNGATDESFQLYLPKAYNSTVNSAIIFIYEPAARGIIGIKPFIPAAEMYNYILVCSNNSKNGPYDANFEIANRLFEHVLSEFKTDPKQIYTSGFSGGSRLATTIATLTNSIQGVIGCGAGFMTNISEIDHPNSFSYIGLVGDEDMNYQEMFRFTEWLKNFDIDNELLTYEDIHSWPPQKQILRAIGWLELQAYKKKIRPYKEDIVTELYIDNYKLADSLENKDQSVLSVIEYERLLRNYDDYFALDSITKKVNTLKATKTYQREIEIRQGIAEKEYKISEMFTVRFNEEATMGSSKDDFEWWRKELKKFDNSYKDSDNYFVTKMWKRLHSSFRALAIESSYFYERNNSLEQLLYCNKLLVVLNPDRPYWFVRLATTYARKNDLKNTLSNLKKAIKLGFPNKDYIKNTKEFNTFKGKRKFDNFLLSLND